MATSGKDKQFKSPRDQYVQSDISLRDLCAYWKDNGWSQSRIYKYSSREKWPQQRENYRRKREAVSDEKKAESESKDLGGIYSEDRELVRLIYGRFRTAMDRVDFDSLKCFKISTEIHSNLRDLVKDIYGIKDDTDDDGISAADFTKALDIIRSASGAAGSTV